MQIPWVCMHCQLEVGASLFYPPNLFDIPESGLIEATCNQGHRSAIVIQQSKFEILAQMGVNAVANGSYRDAVLSLATSLERLYEFFIEAVCRKQGVSLDTFAVTWKQMSSQSERQLGAFLTAYLLETGETPKLLARTPVEFRNSVVHKGRFPTSEEATDFGAVVFDCARPILNVLRSPSYAGIVRTLTMERIAYRSKEASASGLQVATMSVPTPLSLSSPDKTTDFKAVVAACAIRPDFWRSV
jgi:hypothetical protein